MSAAGDLMDLPLGPRGETSPSSGDVPPEPPEDHEPEPSRRGPPVAAVAVAALALVAAGVTVGLLWPRGTPAVARLSASLLDFAEQRVEAESAPREVVISNGGTRPLTVAGVALAGAAAEDFRLVADGCTGRELDGAGECTVLVGFAPAGSPGARSASLEVAGDFGNSPALVPLLGTAVAPVLSLDRHQVRFGERPVGEKTAGATERLVVSNRGTAPLRLGGLEVEGDASGDLSLVSDFCSGRVLRPEERCVVEIGFAPREEGERRAVLTVAGEGVVGSRVELSGIGVAIAVAELAIAPEAIDFGEVRVGAASGGQTVRLANGGRAEARITAVELTGEQAGDFSLTGPCTRVAPGAECALEVRLQPRSTGPRAARLVVRSGEEAETAAETPEAALAVTLTVALTGTGVAPRLAVGTGRLDFGRVVVGRSSERSLTLANQGTASLSLGAFEPAGSAATEFRVVGGDCPTGRAVLGPGVSCRLELRFAPRREGRRTAALRIDHDAADGPREVALEGVALAPPRPELTVAPSSLAFADQPVGRRSGIETVKLANTGNARLSLRGISLEGRDREDFQLVAGSCDGLTFLAPGGDCTVGLRFVPAGAGTRGAELRVRHDAAGGETRVALTGLGLGSSEVID